MPSAMQLTPKGPCTTQMFETNLGSFPGFSPANTFFTAPVLLF